MNLIYFNEDYAIRIHDKILDLSNGARGIKDFNMISSPLTHIRNDDYYPTFEEKLTHLVFSFNKSHGFSDGNKRTSIALGTFFLIINGLETLADKFVIEMENITVAVADNLISKEMLFRIIKSLIYEEDYSEELKLEIIYALLQVVPNPDGNDYIPSGTEFFLDLF